MSITSKIQEIWYSLNLKTRDKLARAGKTAAQTFIFSLPTITVLATLDKAALWSAILSAGSAAVSAAWNSIWPPSTGEVQLVPIIRFPDDLLPPE